jgi:hypothetical protein
MAHISKHPLSPGKRDELFDQMNFIIGRLGKAGASLFFEEFLGPEEKIMLAKRLAAIIMCFEKNTVYRIAIVLKISFSTAERIKLNYQTGKYRSMEKILTENKHAYSQLLKTLEVILQAGLPPRGRGRWKRLFSER